MTKTIKMSLNANNTINIKVNNLQSLFFSNFPESRNFVLASYSQELTSYKLRFEEMLEQTTEKEWYLSIFNT